MNSVFQYQNIIHYQSILNFKYKKIVRKCRKQMYKVTNIQGIQNTQRRDAELDPKDYLLIAYDI